MILKFLSNPSSNLILRSAILNSDLNYQLQKTALNLTAYSAKNYHITAKRYATAKSGKLPRLPVPPLEKTLETYLKSVKPLLNEKEFKRTEEVAKQFVRSGGIGEKLQDDLQKRAANQENWLSDWWLNSAYLEYRESVVVNSSPGLVFPAQKFKCLDEQLACAAKVTYAALEYKGRIDRNEIPEEMMGKKPLDMEQYSKVFGTCRIPGICKDSLEYEDPKNRSKHIVVAYQNQFYKMIVYDDANKILSPCQLMAQLRYITNDIAMTEAIPIGILTTEHRDKWGQAYEDISLNGDNVCSLDDMIKSLFLVCIDQPNPTQGSDSKRTDYAMQMVHGCGSHFNSGNRWFDKTVQFIVGSKGELGLTYEHSPAEGPPIANLMDYIMEYIENNPTIESGSMKNTPFPEPICFNISSEVKNSIDSAMTNINKVVANLEMACFQFNKYGKDFIKFQKLSPDSFIQMAIQFAFYRTHNCPGAHYESASTRQFTQGRTETIRSCSCESVAFSKAMLNPDVSRKDKEEALRAAVNAHKDYTLKAINGEGVDRHLLGLKLTAIDRGVGIPDFYKDVGYTKSSHMRISTSQVASKCDGFMCYGPLVPDGYACCYNPRDKDINFGISANRSNPETSAIKFKESLQQSLMEMFDILCKDQSKL